MRLLIISIILSLINLTAYAEEVFTDSKLKDLRIYDADKETKTAWVIDENENEAEIHIGDAIGIDHGVVIAIEETHIKVQKGKTIRTIKVMKSLEEMESDAAEIDASKAGPLQ